MKRRAYAFKIPRAYILPHHRHGPEAKPYGRQIREEFNSKPQAECNGARFQKSSRDDKRKEGEAYGKYHLSERRRKADVQNFFY